MALNWQSADRCTRVRALHAEPFGFWAARPARSPSPRKVETKMTQMIHCARQSLDQIIESLDSDASVVGMAT